MKSFTFLLALAALLGSDPPGLTVRPLEGEPFPGRLLGIREGQALFEVEQGQRRSLPLSSLEALELSSGSTQARPGPALHLSTGEAIPCDRIQAGPAGGLVAFFRGRALGEVALDDLLGARLRPPAQEGDELAAALSGPPPEGRDLLFLITENGPLKLAAAILEVGARGLLAEVGGRQQQIPLSRLQGFVLAPSTSPRLQAPAPAEVVLAGGTFLRGAILAADVDSLALDHPLLGRFPIPWSEISILYCSRDRVLDLAKARLLSDKAVPAFDRVWPVARDRTLEGNPLLLGDTIHRTGLCFLPRRALSFAVPPGFSRFRAVLGFAPETGARGEARFRILAGKQVLFDRILKGGEPPLPVSLELFGAETLTLEADFGPRLHLGNHCVFASPRLLAAPDEV